MAHKESCSHSAVRWPGWGGRVGAWQDTVENGAIVGRVWALSRPSTMYKFVSAFHPGLSSRGPTTFYQAWHPCKPVKDPEQHFTVSARETIRLP